MVKALTPQISDQSFIEKHNFVSVSDDAPKVRGAPQPSSGGEGGGDPTGASCIRAQECVLCEKGVC